MIENRPWLTVTSHATLMVGIALVALPVWMALVASTHPASAFGVGHIPLWFGDAGVETWKTVLFEKAGNGVETPVFFDDAKLVGDGVGDYLWQNCHFVVVCLCHCFLSLSIPKLLFLGHFHDPNATCRSTNCTDL